MKEINLPWKAFFTKQLSDSIACPASENIKMIIANNLLINRPNGHFDNERSSDYEILHEIRVIVTKCVIKISSYANGLI